MKTDKCPNSNYYSEWIGKTLQSGWNRSYFRGWKTKRYSNGQAQCYSNRKRLKQTNEDRQMSKLKLL